MPDGANIAALIVGMISKHMTFLVEQGMLFIMEGPLYFQDGKFIYPSDDIDALVNFNKPLTRFKGLGEINKDQAKKVFFDPAIRRLRMVTLDGLNDAMAILSSTSARKNLMINRGVLTNPWNV